MKLVNGNELSVELSHQERKVVDLILDNLFCGVLYLNKLGTVINCNLSAKDILGIESYNIIGLNYDNLPLLVNLSKKSDILNGSGRYIVSNGKVDVICNINPVTLNGRRMGSLLILHKSLDDRCIMQELNVTEDLLKEIIIFLESSHDGFLVTDNVGTVIKTNTSFEKIFSIERKELLGKNIQCLVDRKIITESVALSVCRDKKKKTTMEIGTGGRRIISTATPVFNEKNEFTSVVVNVRDITELEVIRRELEYQKYLSESYFKELTQMSQKKFKTGDLVVHSKEMKQILDVIEVIKGVDSPVLIEGETGVGKELIVNEIYKRSNRSQGPIVKINCGSIPVNLFESEFFGYEKGAFTGAKSSGKIGLFELANNGTLFLDEVSELAMDSQVKLLRAIQEGEIRRVGGLKKIKVDVRIIAATNKDMSRLTEEGKFRQDLFYRLNVINIKVPPLRNRRDDIIPLAQFFVDKFNKKYEKERVLSMELAKILRSLYWKGNIRELENLIESMVILAADDVLVPCHLPNRILDTSANEANLSVTGVMPLKDAVKILENRLVRNAMDIYPSMTQAAKALGVSQSTVSRKMKELNKGLFTAE